MAGITKTGAYGTNTTGEIGYRTSGYFSRELLKRAQPLLLLNRFGQPKPLPKNVGKIIKFRGYLPLDTDAKVLIEGVTPSASQPEYRDIETSIQQYGDYIEITDVLQDTHEDPLISEFSDILGEQSAIMLEKVTHGVLLGGTNVLFAGSTGGVVATDRSGVNRPLTLQAQRRVVRALKRQEARQITNVISASPNFNTSPIAPAYIAICHTDIESDIRDLPGFVPAEKYGSYKPMDGEIGACEGVRYLVSNILEPFADAGAAPESGVSVESTSGACADVYPIYFLGKDAYGIVPFARQGRGTSPITPMVLNPNVPRGGDPLGQRGTIAWKAYHAAIILYDFWMARLEVAATKL